METWKTHHPEAIITHRDLACNPVPYIDDTWVTAKFPAADEHTPRLAAAIALSDELIDNPVASEILDRAAPL